MMGIYLKGLALGASLIIAIGAQNAFVLSQGVTCQPSLPTPSNINSKNLPDLVVKS